MNKMTTSEMCDLSIHNYRALESGSQRTAEMRNLTNLRNACDIFSQRAFNDIRKVHETATTKGMSAQEIGFKVLTFCMCGRIMITIKKDGNDDDFITLQGGEDRADGMAGLHGINCDVNVALDWLEILTDKWYLFYDQRGVNNVNKFKTDKQLSIA